MNERDTPRGRRHAPLRPDRWGEGLRLTRHAAGDLAPWVDYLWIVRWDLDDPHTSAVIPQPVVHVAAESADAEQGRLLVHGVGRATFHRTLSGTGHVIGVAFRAGGFRAFADGPVSALAHRVVPVADVTGVDDRPLAAALLDPGADDDALVARYLTWLAACEPARDEVADTVAALVDTAEHDRTVTRPEHLTERAGVSLRTLQRWFGEYVGIGPRWVVRRFRLLDAAAAAHADSPVDWAGLADELGFADQAHLTREFRAVTGRPPATYVREARGEGEHADRGSAKWHAEG